MHPAFLIVLVLLSAACAGHSAASLPEAPLLTEAAATVSECPPAGSFATQSVISSRELQGTRAANLYDAIRRLRPAYFTVRGPESIYNQPEMGMVVIVNRHVIGAVDELESMGVSGLACVRRLSAADVALITGTTALDGGIELVLHTPEP